MTKKRRKPVALAPPPHQQSSRKKARKMTTLFHKYTRQRDAALASNDQEEVDRMDRAIEAMGGRAEYQRASQVSTSFFSTSKWVLGVLSRNGWLYGIKKEESDDQKETKKHARRPTRLLEVGAINTELLDAAAQTVVREGGDKTHKYKLSVRALDIHSMHQGIEEADFLEVRLISPNDPAERYDVIVCSMVLNCVTLAADRGKMITRLFHFLRPGGLCFITIPKSCLTLSPYMDKTRFCQLLEDAGLSIQETKDSPKVSFFQCERAAVPPEAEVAVKWHEQKKIRRGKKYRNDFAVTLSKECILSAT